MPQSRRVSLLVAAGFAVALFTALLATVQAGSGAAPLAPDAVMAVEYATGLDDPVDVTNTGISGDERLFVVERDGRIKIIPPGGGVVSSTPFLDINNLVIDGGGEQGLLGLAFHPEYENNWHFFVYYVNNSGDMQLSRFSRSAGNADLADTNETPLLTIPHPGETNHNGGDLAFGPDGYLYAAPGDGGGGGDLNNSAQTFDNLLGKVLRLDVTDVPTYTIPATNPFTSTIGERGEIWAYGLRNPFRFSFDRDIGDLYIGDVGQGAWEEINYQPAASTGGENYGWHCFEGTHPYPSSSQNTDCDGRSPHTIPKAEYCNTDASCTTGGQAVIAGYVYRGATNPGMFGIYFFADNGSRRFWAMELGTWEVVSLNISNVPNPSSFGEDVDGELYVVSLTNGRVYRLQGSTPFVLLTPSFLPLIRK